MGTGGCGRTGRRHRHAALWGDWRDWLAEVASALVVDAPAIERVADRYLIETNLTAGWSLSCPRRWPGSEAALVTETASMSLASSKDQIAARVVERGAERSKRPATPAAAPAPAPANRFLACPRSRFPAVSRGWSITVPGGCGSRMDCASSTSGGPTGVVALELYVDAGFLREDRPGVSYLTGRLLEEGTRNRTAPELAAAIEDVGGTMEVSPACSSLRFRVEDLPLACELLADLVRQPVFPPEPSNGPSSEFWPSCKTIGKIRPVRPT